LATFAVAQVAPASNSTSNSTVAPSSNSSSSFDDIIDVDSRAGFTCYFWSDNMLFDLSTLQKTNGDYNTGYANWNYCAFARMPKGNNDTFAYMWNPSQMSSPLMMTNDDLILDEVEVTEATNTTA
jgi:hypothetical protein